MRGEVGVGVFGGGPFQRDARNAVYKSSIVLHNYEPVNLMDFPESVQGWISQIQAKLDART